MSAIANLVSFPGAAPSPAPGVPPGSSGPAAHALIEAVEEPGAVTLYGAEDQLAALLNCLDLVPPEQEEELVAAIGAALAVAVDKRDRVCRFLGHLESQVGYGKDEIKRLKARVDLFEGVLAKFSGYLERVVVNLGKDSKGKWRKLEGQVSTIGVKNLPASVEIDDETQVPTAYCRTTVTLPSALWERITDELPVELACEIQDSIRKSVEAQKSLIKSAIDAGNIVPGAHLATGRVKLVRA